MSIVHRTKETQRKCNTIVFGIHFNVRQCYDDIYLLHNVVLGILLDMSILLVLYKIHRSYIVDSKVLFGNMDPYNLPGIGKSSRDYTNRHSHTFYYIPGRVLIMWNKFSEHKILSYTWNLIFKSVHTTIFRFCSRKKKLLFKTRTFIYMFITCFSFFWNFNMLLHLLKIISIDLL